MDRGKSWKEAVDELAVIYPNYTKQIQAYYSRWEEMIIGPIHGTVKILEGLRGAGYPLVALSNWSAETFPIALERFEFLSWFDPLIISGEIDLVKPAPEIYHYLLREISREAEECIFIDDSEANVLMAEELGFISIHFSSPEQLQVKLEEIGVVDYG
jgi:2-haloacid dehalogenase